MSMVLTPEQQAILDGGQGEVMAKVMKTLAATFLPPSPREHKRGGARVAWQGKVGRALAPANDSNPAFRLAMRGSDTYNKISGNINYLQNYNC